MATRPKAQHAGHQPFFSQRGGLLRTVSGFWSSRRFGPRGRGAFQPVEDARTASGESAGARGGGVRMPFTSLLRREQAA